MIQQQPVTTIQKPKNKIGKHNFDPKVIDEAMIMY